MNITLRDAVDADEAFGRKVHHKAYYDVVVSQFGEWDTNTQNAYYEQVWHSSPHRVIEVDGTPAGCLSSETHGDHIFISEIQLLPEFQNRGIGTLLIRQVLAEGDRLRLPVRLQVLKENRAVQLYRRLGFRVSGRTKTHIRMQYKPGNGA